MLGFLSSFAQAMGVVLNAIVSFFFRSCSGVYFSRSVFYFFCCCSWVSSFCIVCFCVYLYNGFYLFPSDR